MSTTTGLHKRRLPWPGTKHHPRFHRKEKQMLQTAQALLETALKLITGIDIDSPIPYEITAKGHQYLNDRDNEQRAKTE